MKYWTPGEWFLAVGVLVPVGIGAWAAVAALVCVLIKEVL